MSSQDDLFNAALGRLAARVESQQGARAAAWERIRADAPELADVLTAVRGAFGKPARVRVSIRGERVI